MTNIKLSDTGKKLLNNGSAVNEIVKAFTTQREAVFAENGVLITVGGQSYRVKSAANLNVPSEEVK